MRTIFVISLCVLLNMSLYAQDKRANIWQILSSKQLNFNYDFVQVNSTSTTLNFNLQCASMCDTSGNLLFYTNGKYVINSLHDTMPNGDSLVGINDEFNGAIIIPKPLSNNIYYIFHTTEWAIPYHIYQELRYSVVDMNSDNGLGDIIEKEVLVCDSVGGTITATYHSNKTDVWLIIHNFEGTIYKSFLITPNGIDTIPIISETGYSYDSYGNSDRGQLKISPDGSRIANAFSPANNLDISRFDNSNGIISNTISIADNSGGVEFSPDNKKVYSTGGLYLYQYNLDYWNVDSIQNSKKIVYSETTYTANLSGAQLATDGKIYIARGGKQYLGVINNPNASGTACDFVLDGLYLNGKTSSSVLPNFISNYFDFSTSIITPELNNGIFEMYPNPASFRITIISKQLSENENQLVLYDLFGKQVLATEIKEQTIDISLVTQGVYVYKIIDNKGILKSGKLVIMR